MEQIYYTQCPVGYGLGASNGFQVKRLSRGYPMSGDFRHLGLKAYPGGSRSLAPPTLRYRRDCEIAEIAWLSPRTHEYETERGLWGRPGGHFAHGLRLDPVELKAIKFWPAGLFESPLWKRTDRKPSRDPLPEDVDLTTPGWFVSPEFAEVARLAEGIDPDRLARLLTALARVTREGRTLFVIDEPARLGPLMALLTFAFPEKFRDELTFSTYHDRAEELPGFRLSGTIPLARPNKPALTAQGVVADLTRGTFEPGIEPASWALTLAHWFIRHDPVDEADWSATDARTRSAKWPTGTETPWSDEWLNCLFAYPQALRTRTVPGDPSGWQELANFTGWLQQTNLADEWVRPRNTAWWAEAFESGREIAEARASLVAHLTLKDAWRGETSAPTWGDVVARWFREADASERDSSIETILSSSPKAKRPAFTRALLRGLTTSGAEALLTRLRDDPSADQAMLLPLEASAAVVAILEGGDLANLTRIAEKAVSLPGATSAVLDAVEAGVVDQPEKLPILAERLTICFDLEAPGEGREGIAWALRRGSGAIAWLEPALRPVLADLDRQDLWAALLSQTPEDARPSLARTILGIAADPGLPDEAFRWGIEAILLPLAPRPHLPGWAETYLVRTPSYLDLFKRLVATEYRKLGVLDWLKQARSRDELSPAQVSRIDSCLDYARALKSKDPNSLLKIQVPDVPAEERGQVLGQMLANVGGESFEGLLFVLDVVRQAWPGAFDPGAPALRTLAWPLTRCLASFQLPAAPWFARLHKILEGLDLSDGTGRGSEPDSLAAEIVALTPRLAGATADPWPLRKFLFDRPDHWRLLARDLQRELEARPVEEAPDVLLSWHKVFPMSENDPSRIFELLLNACDGVRLTHAIPALLPDLSTLRQPRVAWWANSRWENSVNDFREGFARIIPFAPLPFLFSPQALIKKARAVNAQSLSSLIAWVESRKPPQEVADPHAPISMTDEPDDPGEKPKTNSPLSTMGEARWHSILALTSFSSALPKDRYPIVTSWEQKGIPDRILPEDERRRMAAWVIFGLDPTAYYEPERLAKWLVRSGIHSPDWLSRWSDEIEGMTEIPGKSMLERASLVDSIRRELVGMLRLSQGKKSPQLPR